MQTDANLPPGCSSRDFERARNRPVKLRCIGCGLDFPVEQLDDDELCETCRREKLPEDDPKEER